MNINKELIDLYEKKQLDVLCSRKWNIPVDENGSSIIHVIAKKLDRNSLEMMIKINPRKVLEYVNIPNNNNEYPIQHALKSNETDFTKVKKFIKFMIEEMKSEHVINEVAPKIQESETLSEKVNKLNIMNNKIIENINKLTKSLNEKTIINKKSDVSTGMNLQKKFDLDFVEKLVDEHFGTSKLSGGYDENDMYGGKKYSGKRKIQKYVNQSISENGDNDSFRLDDENDMFRNFDMERVGNFKENSEKLKGLLEIIMKTLKVSEEDAKLYRGAIKHELLNGPDGEKLRKDDDAKVEAMSKIVNDSKALKAFAKKINLDELRELTTKLSEERKKKETKKPKKQKNNKVSESGYLLSNEIIFSDS